MNYIFSKSKNIIVDVMTGRTFLGVEFSREEHLYL